MFAKVGRVVTDNRNAKDDYTGCPIRWDSYRYAVFHANRWVELTFPVSHLTVEW